MEKIIFRTKKDFDIEHDFKKVLAAIERIKSRCQDYKIRETFGGHPANAFDGMSLPLNETETFLHDDYSIFYNAADSLLGVNKSITGEYGWDGIADIVDTHTGVGMDDHHWTLNTYQLKPEFFKSSPQLLQFPLSLYFKNIRLVPDTIYNIVP